MRILSIESSATTASIAILDDDVLRAEYTINYKKTHSQTLLPMIDEIFKMTETEKDSIDVVAVSEGPGSFTGLRIGIATAKGIALALGKKTVGVPTLEALASNYYGTELKICPIMDARREHVYNAVYHYEKAANGHYNLIVDKEQRLILIDDLLDELEADGSSVLVLGDASGLIRDKFEKRQADKAKEIELIYAPAAMNSLKASSLALRAQALIDEGKLVDSSDLKPDYLRPSQAERERANASL